MSRTWSTSPPPCSRLRRWCATTACSPRPPPAPATVVFGHDAYPDIFEKAASLMHSLMSNHALIDGNKRLAWSAAVVFLALNNFRVPRIDVDAAEQFVFSIAKGDLSEVGEIARQLRAVYVMSS